MGHACCPRTGIIIFHNLGRIFAINPKEDRIIWELGEEFPALQKINEFKRWIDVHDFGLFTIYTQFKIHIFDSLTGKKIHVFDISHLHDDPWNRPEIKIINSANGYMVIVIDASKL